MLNLREKRRLYKLGLEAFNTRRFYEAHEFWEEVWLHTPAPDKTFLQGLIQVAAAFHHHSRSNLAGTRSLLHKGLLKLNVFPDSYGGIEVEPLRRAVRKWLRLTRAGKPSNHVALPQIAGDAEASVFVRWPKGNAGKSAALRPSQGGRRGRP